MKISNDKFKIDDKSILNYYEIKSNKPKLLLLHAQGTNSLSFMSVINKLSKYFHIYLVDYYGHGKSSFNREKYNLVDIGNDIIKFIEDIIKDNVSILDNSGNVTNYSFDLPQDQVESNKSKKFDINMSIVIFIITLIIIFIITFS